MFRTTDLCRLPVTLAVFSLVSLLAPLELRAESLTVLWDANTEPVAGYAVYVGPQSGSLTDRHDVGGSTSFTLTSATPGQQYCFAVAAYVNPLQEGPRSSAVCGTAAAQPPPAGSGGSGGGAPPPPPPVIPITALWDPNAESVSGYIVHYGTQPGSLAQQRDVGNTTTFTVADAVAGQQYCFRVAAYVNPAQPGPLSSEVCGFGNQAPTLVNPGNRSSTAGQPASLQLIGGDPDGNPVSYGANGLPPGLTVQASTGFISGTGSVAGSYPVTAWVTDGLLSSSQSFTWTVTSAPVSDTTPPTLNITNPTTGSTFTTTSSSIVLAGSASDNVGVASVTWANNRGGNGTANGTTSWSTSSIGLQQGTNLLTVTARDGAGNQSTRTLSVDRQSEAPASLILSGSSYTRGRWLRVLLAWNALPNIDSIIIYRDGQYVTTTSNNGSYSESLKQQRPYTYQVCVSGGTLCSNTFLVTP